MPETLSKLTKLQFLLLDGNQLSGSLPAFLGQLPDLKQVQLQNNNFSGSVPPSWCSGSTVYDVAGNRHLCGEQRNLVWCCQSAACSCVRVCMLIITHSGCQLGRQHTTSS